MATIGFADVSHIIDVAQFGGLHGIAEDFESTAAMADYLCKACESGFPGGEIVDAFSTAIITRYCRPFVGGVRAARHAEDALARVTEEQRMLHRFLMTMRDKHIAHSVNVLEETRVVAQYRVGREDDGFISFSVQYNRVIGLPEAGVAAIAELSRTLLGFIRERIDAEEARIFPLPQSLPAAEIIATHPSPTWASDTDPIDVRRPKP